MSVANQSHLKILFLPAKSTYISETNPIAGIFISEQAKAASLYNDMVVLYVYPDPSPQPKFLSQISEDIDNGIRTIRVKYVNIPAYFKKLVFGKRVTSAGGPKYQTSSSTDSSKFMNILRNTFRIPRIMAEELLYYGSVLAAFRRLVEEGWRPDIINAHYSLAGMPAFILGKLYKIPVVISEQGGVLPRHLLKFPGGTTARFAMNRAEIVLAVSDAMRKNVEACGVKNKFQIVPNTVNTEMFYPLPSRKRNKKKRLLLVALLSPLKGVSYLLEALAQVKERRQDFVLDIIGDGGERAECEELTKSLGLGEMVRFHGLKPKHEVAEFMRNCDFYLLPSLSESFGVTYIEAMACGKPIIACDVGGVKEVVGRGNAILVPPGDVRALTEAIEDMLDSYIDYSPEGISQYVRERFSYEVVGEMLDQVYRRVVMGNKSARGQASDENR